MRSGAIWCEKKIKMNSMLKPMCGIRNAKILCDEFVWVFVFVGLSLSSLRHFFAHIRALGVVNYLRDRPERINASNWSVEIKGINCCPVACHVWSKRSSAKREEEKRKTLLSTNWSQIVKVTQRIKQWQSEYWLAVCCCCVHSLLPFVQCAAQCTLHTCMVWMENVEKSTIHKKRTANNKKTPRHELWIKCSAANVFAHCHIAFECKHKKPNCANTTHTYDHQATSIYEQ